MIDLRRFVPILPVLMLLGCSAAPVVQMPQYEADVYPLSQTIAGVTIGIDEITRPERAERYFGADLLKAGILPVSIAVSNHGKERVIVKPSDVLLHRGKDVMDPLPLEFVVATARRQYEFFRSKSEKEVAKFFESAMFKETLVKPNGSYRGVMFFAAPAPKRASERFLAALGVRRDGDAGIRVGLTNRDTGERLLFGPFSLTFPDNARLSSSSAY
jgi:hypothetical protein